MFLWSPLQETIAYFCGPTSLTFSDKSAILKLKGVENEIIILYMMFRKAITFIYEKIQFGDRVPEYVLQAKLASPLQELEFTGSVGPEILVFYIPNYPYL